MVNDPRWRRVDAEAAIMMYVCGWSMFTIGAVLRRPWTDVSDLLTRPAVEARVRALLQ